MNDICRKKDCQLKSLRKQNKVQLQKAMGNYSESVCVDDIDDTERGRQALELLKPLVAKKMGEQSEETIMSEQMIAGISRPIGCKPRYNTATQSYGIELAAQTKADMNDKVSTLLCLPTSNPIKNCREKLSMGRMGATRLDSNLTEQTHKRKNIFAKGHISVCLAFDAMVMKKYCTLVTKCRQRTVYLVYCVE